MHNKASKALTFTNIIDYNQLFLYNEQDKAMRPVIISIIWLLSVLVTCVTGCGNAHPGLLMYDDGEMDDSRHITNNGCAIKFTIPKGEWEIKSVRFFAIRKGAPDVHDKKIRLYICEGENADHVLAEKSVPMDLVDTNTPKWRIIDLDVPLYRTGNFWVIIDPDSAEKEGMFMGIDNSVKVSHSKMGRPGTLSDLESVYNWMIRVDIKKAVEENKGDKDGG
jgi:hypothetical protein